MPLYDYQCSACGAVFETEHAMSARPKVKCAACGSMRTAKLFNAAGVQFKGSGFYVTDSRGKDAAAAPSAAPGAAEAKPAADSKPADKPSAPAKPSPGKDGGSA